MPTYPVINLKTKEKKELSMTMKQYDEWRNAPENADWDKDWQAGCASPAEMFRWSGEAASSGWNEVLDRASKQPGANISKHRDYSF